MSLGTKIVDWLDERAGVRALWAEAANEPIPGGARMTYVFGSVLLYLFVQQVVLGIMIAMFYSPSATDAWASVAYLQDQVTAGWFIRGLHHHGSSAMVVVTVLHLLQVTWYGAYRRPRELNWLLGVGMGGLVLAFALTGYLLPWDQKGYWATQVATGIMGSVPGGEPQRIFLQGGTEYGNFTITRFYALHVFVLPLALALLMVAHVGLFRRHGVTPPPGLSPAKLRERVDPFIPNQLAYDVLAMAITAGVLVMLTVKTHGAELLAPAQPASNFPARPEWYFLFLFQLLKYFEGPLSIVATVIIPGAVATFLLALPWIDRAQSRSPKERMPVLAGVGALMVGVAVLTGLAVNEDSQNEKLTKALAEAEADAERARHWALQGVLPEGGEAVFRNDPAYKRRALFKEHCSQCHGKDGKGGDDAPALVGWGSRAWLRGLVRNPGAPEYFGKTDHDTMDGYGPDDVPDVQLDAVVEYIVSTMGDEISPPADATLAARGKKLWEDELECNSCHEIEPGEAGDGPNLHGHGTRAWIEALIRNPKADTLFGEDAEMPAFEKKLTDEEIGELAQFVIDLRSPKSGGEGAAPAPHAGPDGDGDAE